MYIKTRHNSSEFVWNPGTKWVHHLQNENVTYLIFWTEHLVWGDQHKNQRRIMVIYHWLNSLSITPSIPPWMSLLSLQILAITLCSTWFLIWTWTIWCLEDWQLILITSIRNFKQSWCILIMKWSGAMIGNVHLLPWGFHIPPLMKYQDHLSFGNARLSETGPFWGTGEAQLVRILAQLTSFPVLPSPCLQCQPGWTLCWSLYHWGQGHSDTTLYSHKTWSCPYGYWKGPWCLQIGVLVGLWSCQKLMDSSFWCSPLLRWTSGNLPLSTSNISSSTTFHLHSRTI